MANNMDRNLQIKDVYDCACDIFQEFEKIVTITGIDDASMLINKVKNVLELLEESVKKIETLDKEFAELKSKCSRLISDKLLKEEEIENLKHAFEELEDSWAKESLNFTSLISKLTAENKILQHKLAEKKDVPFEVENAFKTVIEDQENLISKLKSNLKQKDSRFDKDQVTIEQLNAKIQHLTEINKSLHLHNQEAQEMIAALKQEKNESEEELNHQGEKLHNLVENFDELKKTITETCEFKLQNMLDIYKPLREELTTNEEKLRSLYQEQRKLKQEVKDLKLELTVLKIQLDEYERELLNDTEEQNQDCLEAHGNLNQGFRLFLEVFNDHPQMCVLRNKRMYSS